MARIDTVQQQGQRPSSATLFLAFTKIGLTSFGGGLSGWMLRDFVQRRRWLSEDEFLTGLSLAQAFPGVNVVNIAIWIGYRMAGTLGSVAATLGLLSAPMVVVVLIGQIFARLSGFPQTHIILAGIAAAAVGLSLTLGLRMARRVAAQDAVSAAVMVCAFTTVGLLRWPMVWVAAVLAPLSIGIAWKRAARRA